jgi:hypothetical protein
MTGSQRLADNVILLIVARVSMVLALPTIGLVAWLYSSWQDDRLDSIRDQIASAQGAASQASELASKTSDRLIAVETKQTQESASSDRFQAATLSRLDRVQDSIVGLSNAVAALTATIQSIVENDRERRRAPLPPS